MRDPFPLAPPPFLTSLIQPLASYLALPTLPLHIHELLLATLTYHGIYRYISPYISTRLFPTIYPKLTAKTRLNWDVHVVSLAQSCLINSLALWVMFANEERSSMDWEQRVWGYTGADGMIQGFAAGYFLWDLFVCAGNVDVFGFGLLAHAVAALVVFSLGFWYNGIILLSSFFCCRLLWGSYQSVRVFRDVWSAWNYDSVMRSKPVFEPTVEGLELMRFAGDYVVPTWLACVYLGSNVVLNTLNFYWFGKMIETIKKRFQEKPGDKRGPMEREEGVMVEGLMDSSTLITDIIDDVNGSTVLVNGDTGKGEIEAGSVNAKSVIEVKQIEVRRRKA
ncbi:hypothetical protein P7C71_g2063, partial [Lecanoromycetidae sp. Uapishka_2]